MKINPSVTVAATVGLLLVVSLALPVFAGPPTDQLRSRVERVASILENPGLRGQDRAAERRAAIRQAADDIFDFQEMTKQALGRHWEARTPSERAEFVNLFADLLRRTYYGQVDGATFDKIVFRDERQEGDEAVVRTSVVLRRGEVMDLDYQLLRLPGDRWKVYDLKFQGVSLIANYRSQFNHVIRTSSYESLVTRMKSNRAEFASQ